MKIVFIVGAAQAGADGVGDYSRSLAAALIQAGHQASLVATHDAGVDQSVTEEQACENVSITALRLPRTWSNDHRIIALQAHLIALAPDWVSVQYVPYAFHVKGLPWQFTRSLAKVLLPYKVHLMFHECWVGISTISPLRHRVIGRLQSTIAKRMTEALQPEAIHTSNPLYREVLAGAGITATVLPLFSNIPRLDDASPVSWEQKGSDVLNTPLEGLQEKYLVAGIFGTIYPEVDLAHELKLLNERALLEGRELLLLTLGRSSAEGMERLTDIVAASPSPPVWIKLGELPAAEVSAALRLLEVSISCTPRQHLGKSGVFAAMRLHEVEVIANVDEELPEYQELSRKAIDALYARPAASWSVTWVADRLAHQLLVPEYQQSL